MPNHKAIGSSGTSSGMHGATERRSAIREWLGLCAAPRHVEVTVTHTETVQAPDGRAYEQRRIEYTAPDGDRIPAYFLVPSDADGDADVHVGAAPRPGVVIHHQHNGERHLGKSEVAGLAGDPLQAFGAALVCRGFVVLAPDSVCFEDRRTGQGGTVPHDTDWQQHYNAMAERLVRGDTLMRKVLDDAATAVSVLSESGLVDVARLGVLGHSYGGNTVIFQTALDERVRFACTSGAACSYRRKLARGTGIEMAEVIPGVVDRFDIDDLLGLTAPRPLLVVSATVDPYSEDAADLVRLAQPAYGAAKRPGALEHVAYDGGHALTAERFDQIIEWMVKAAAR